MRYGRAGSLPAPTPEQREYAELLLERAKSDLAALRVLLANGDMLDDVVGFHAQQAVEKTTVESPSFWQTSTSRAPTIFASWQISPSTTISKSPT